MLREISESKGYDLELMNVILKVKLIYSNLYCDQEPYEFNNIFYYYKILGIYSVLYPDNEGNVTPITNIDDITDDSINELYYYIDKKALYK